MRLARTLEDSSTESPYNEEHGIKVETRYKTVSGYTYQLTSNPFRANYSTNETDATMGWTLSTAWSNGRRTEVETFSGSALPIAFGGNNTNSTGKVVTEIDANATTVTDQAGKKRRSVTNALGQLIRVDEPDAAGNLGPVTNPVQPTYYSYDVLNNLTQVVQGVQTRTFTYNSLSRLTAATNPESGTIQYGYDSNGNLTTKTDARSITTTYAYDALNRVTQRSYSDSTPAVSYFYDNLTNGKGKLTKVTSSVSTTEYTGFDILGRVTGHKQTTDGQSYTTGYTYNLAGALIEQTYPSGRVVKNVLDAKGDLSMVQSKKNAAAGYWNYAENFTYNAAGAVTSMQLGNGRWESTQFNSRIQPTQIALGATSNATNLLKLDYSYGTTANNGNVLSQTITVPTVGANVGFVAVQTYNYDSLNRLKSAIENVTTHGGSATQSWKQTFTFDRYGNRNFDEANTSFTGFEKLCNNNTELCADVRKIMNPSINQSNNRLSSSDEYAFDSAGNTTNDPQGRTFIYDGENKQKEVRDQYNTVIGQYFYDGDGKRVKKIVPATGETTIFVYDASGKLVAEYSTQVESIENAKVAYLTNDHLGSPRILTDQFGAVISRRDFMPFGEEIASGTGGRVGGQGYFGSDSIRQKFTGYQRDSESSLDFAEARMYGYSLGRFTSPDDFLKDTKPIEPASWNLYVYVRNNPLKYIDSSGESVDGTGLSDEERTRLIAEFARLTGYRVEDLSFGSNGLLSVASGAKSVGGSAKARTLLNEAISSAWEFVLVGVNTTDVAFAEHAPTLKPAIVRPDGSRVSGGVYGQVRIDFADFNNAVFEDDAARQTFSLGITVLHEFVHGLYPALSDSQGGGAGEIENNWINPIRSELGLATRDVYSATQTTFTNQQGQPVQGVQLSFTRYEYGPLQEPTFRNPFPEEGTYPVTTHVYWQLNTVGGRVRR